jgi:hypothetical protein
MLLTSMDASRLLGSRLTACIAAQSGVPCKHRRARRAHTVAARGDGSG